MEILAEQCKALVFAIQELKLGKDGTVYLRGFKSYLKIKEVLPNQKAHGGVGVLVSNKCQSHEIQLNTPLQAIAVSVKLFKRITVCSFYVPPNANTGSFQKDLENLIEQLPKPFLILGDFNARSPLWYCEHTDARGEAIEKILYERDLYLLDQNKDTHYYKVNGQLKTSHIDLSLCSTSLLLDFEWGLYDQPLDSDHFPVWLRSGRKRRPTTFPKWVFKKADWEKFSANAIPRMSVSDFDNVNEASDYCKTFIIDAANESIPKTSGEPSEYKCLWWNPNCTDIKQERRRTWKKFANGEIPESEWNKIKAKARQTFNWNKRQSWIKLIESIHGKACSKEVWRKIRILLKKYSSNAVVALLIDGQLVDDPKKVADKLGESFADISSEANCTQKFLRFKKKMEKKFNFSTNAKLEYNLPFTKEELDAAFDGCGDTAAGPDEIHNKLLKNLSEGSKQYLLDLFNFIFKEGIFPEDWKLAHIIPILKKGKDPLDPKSYRPISLLSCLSKLFERMLNIRLIYVLESNNLLSKFQTGSRSGRCAQENLLALEDEIHDAFLQNKLLVSIFFDLEKAYDTCWSQIILGELHRFGLRGNLPIIIDNYLSGRKFKVRVGNQLSKTYNQEMGVPQGGILSVILFIIAMNTVSEFIFNTMTHAMYVDDLRISFLSSRLSGAQRNLNMLLKNLQNWMDRTGFKFSTTKTKAVIFRRGRRWTNLKNEDLKLNLRNEQIEVVNVIKLLGHLLDEKFTGLPQINALKKKCTTDLNAIKIMVKYSKASDMNFLLRIYRSLILSKLDYGSQIYGTVGVSYLTRLDTVHHAALRLCTGAYRTTDSQSLYVEANEPSLTNRRLLLDLQFFVRTKRIPNRKKFISWEDSYMDSLYDKKSNVYFKPMSYGYKTRTAIKDVNISIPKITKLRLYVSPPWTLEKLNICLYLAKFPKSETLPVVFQQEFYAHKHTAQVEVYTDGSKINEKVGSGFVVVEEGKSDKKFSLRIHDNSSVFIAELFAIRAAIEYLRSKFSKVSCQIYSDSRSALQALNIFNSKHPLVQIIQEAVFECKSAELFISFCWLPGHCFIPGNDVADSLARKAIEKTTFSLNEVYASDFNQVLRAKVNSIWQNQWNVEINRGRAPLTEITQTVNKKRNLSGLTRVELRKFTRLRVGYTKFSSQHIIKKEDPLLCNGCGFELSVKHALIECPDYHRERMRCFGNGPLDIKVILDKEDASSIRNVLDFFKQINLYYNI